MTITKKKEKALAIVPRMPYPLNSGGRIAIYDALNLLSTKYTLIIVIIDDDKNNVKYVDDIKAFAEEVYFFSFNKYRCYFNSVVGLLKGKPLQVSFFYFSKVQKLVNELSTSCDFFYAFMIRTTSYGIKLNLKKGHYAIDSMYLNYKKSEQNAISKIWKLIYKIELPLLYKYEKEQIEGYDLTTFVNRDEAAFWKNNGSVFTLPHGVKVEILNYLKFDNRYQNIVSFIGRMDYQPNIDAVVWFCNNVFKYLDTKIEFWIIGGYATPEIQKIAKQYMNIKILGFIQDPYIILRSCICTIAPMQTGGGLQTKILMAMAVESLVITTSLPVKAIEDAKNWVNMIIEDEPKKFAEIINDAYNNPFKYQSIKVAAKKLILKVYSLDVIEEKLFDLIDNHLIGK